MPEDVTPDVLASVEADNERKREVLSALKAQEAAIVEAASLRSRDEELLAEGKRLDAQIDNQLDVIVGHAGTTTDIDQAKADMLAAVEQQVADQDAAQAKAQAEADAAAASATPPAEVAPETPPVVVTPPTPVVPPAPSIPSPSPVPDVTPPATDAPATDAGKGA